MVHLSIYPISSWLSYWWRKLYFSALPHQCRPNFAHLSVYQVGCYQFTSSMLPLLYTVIVSLAGASMMKTFALSCSMTAHDRKIWHALASSNVHHNSLHSSKSGQCGHQLYHVLWEKERVSFLFILFLPGWVANDGNYIFFYYVTPVLTEFGPSGRMFI